MIFDGDPRQGADGPDFVARLRRGEDSAFEELVRAHGPRMLAVAKRYLPQETDAQDALQDAFINVARSIGTFNGESLLGTWLHRVIVNAALMRLRTRGRRTELCADTATLEAASESNGVSRDTWTTAEPLARAELRRMVREEVARLPESYRVVLVLRDLEGQDLREIAALLDVGLTTVKMRLHHGRRALRAALEPRLASRVP